MNNVITLNEMQSMNIDDIIDLYRNGYTIEENVNEKNISDLDPKIVSADISVSTGSLFLIGAAVLIYVLLRR
jgi:hypothetical protein